MTRAGIAVRSAALVLLVVAPALLDNYRVFLLTEILIFGLFAASLDLLVGYSGLPSLGHAGYFGVGAYAAGLLALHVTSNAFAESRWRSSPPPVSRQPRALSRSVPAACTS